VPLATYTWTLDVAVSNASGSADVTLQASDPNKLQRIEIDLVKHHVTIHKPVKNLMSLEVENYTPQSATLTVDHKQINPSWPAYSTGTNYVIHYCKDGVNCVDPKTKMDPCK
jgi:hypothetical protein